MAERPWFAAIERIEKAAPDKQFAPYVRLRTELMKPEGENLLCVRQPPQIGDDAPILGAKRFKDRIGRLPDSPRKQRNSIQMRKL